MGAEGQIKIVSVSCRALILIQWNKSMQVDMRALAVLFSVIIVMLQLDVLCSFKISWIWQNEQINKVVFKFSIQSHL